ncbi:MAG: class I SAM-dependent methyltransferase, partial [Bacteroidota bacterium]
MAYDRYRPSYPTELVDALLSQAQIKKGASILEIACGTGQITLEFLNRGYQIIAVEKGAQLAKIARHKTKHFPKIDIQTADFNEWHSPKQFDLVICAQAFHW